MLPTSRKPSLLEAGGSASKDAESLRNDLQIAADCTVIAADHPESAANEVIDDAGFLVEPTVEALTETLDAALSGKRPPTNPVERAQQYDWDAVADQAETAYKRAIGGAWWDVVRARVLPLCTCSGIGVAAIGEGIVDVNLDPIERDDGLDRAAGAAFFEGENP